VVTGGVVEDLADHPPAGLLVDDEQRRAAGVAAGRELVVLAVVVIHGLGPRVGVPAVLAVQVAEQVVATQ
jgi:hypothetical protein